MPARDLGATLAFYERLDFESRDALWQQGGAEPRFWADPDVDPLTSSFGCYLRVADTDELWRTSDAVGVPTDPRRAAG